jgi:hypothetical protein
MVLQPRDFVILKLCYEQQFLTIEHLAPFFKNESKQQVLRRLRELREAGFIETRQMWHNECRLIVRLSKQGLRLTKARAEHDVPYSRSVDAVTLEHDALVTSVRLRLAQSWDFTWLPERALKDRYSVVPDGVVSFSGGISFAVEVEHSIKGASRRLALLEKWERVGGISLVLYVATSQTIFAAWQRSILERPRTIGFALLQWSELRNGTPEAWTPKGAVALFQRRSFG